MDSRFHENDTLTYSYTNHNLSELIEQLNYFLMVLFTGLWQVQPIGASFISRNYKLFPVMAALKNIPQPL